MERFRQKQMKLDKLTQPVWKDTVYKFFQTDMKHGTSGMRVPAVVELHTDDDAAAPAPRTIEKLMESFDIVPGKSQMPQGTSRPESSHMSLGSQEAAVQHEYTLSRTRYGGGFITHSECKACSTGKFWPLHLAISGKCNSCTTFTTCQLLLDFSDQIVRHDNLSVHVQGSNAPY